MLKSRTYTVFFKNRNEAIITVQPNNLGVPTAPAPRNTDFLELELYQAGHKVINHLTENGGPNIQETRIMNSAYLL
jgi:hypothetical protein